MLILFACFFTSQPSSGLKKLITEVHQQVLTVHAHKHRTDSKEDASSHHPADTQISENELHTLFNLLTIGNKPCDTHFEGENSVVFKI